MVLESVLFGILAAIGWGTADFVGAVVSKKLGLLRTVVGIHVASVGVTTAYAAVFSSLGRLSPGDWVALSGVGALAVVTYIAFYRALQLGPVAIVSPIVSTYAVIVILLAIVFAGERLNAGQAIGASASICGVVLASTNFQALSKGEQLIGAGVLFGLTATVGLGVWQYSIGVLSKELGWFLPVYMNRLFTLGLLAPFIVVRREWPWQRLTLPLLLGVITAGLVETVGIFAFARGSEIGVISIVAAASITYPVLPILGGLIVFRERLNVTQVAGLAFALAGLFVLALST